MAAGLLPPRPGQDPNDPAYRAYVEAAYHRYVRDPGKRVGFWRGFLRSLKG